MPQLSGKAPSNPVTQLCSPLEVIAVTAGAGNVAKRAFTEAGESCRLVIFTLQELVTVSFKSSRLAGPKFNSAAAAAEAGLLKVCWVAGEAMPTAGMLFPKLAINAGVSGPAGVWQFTGDTVSMVQTFPFFPALAVLTRIDGDALLHSGALPGGSGTASR
jgi:hypothetical protein